VGNTLPLTATPAAASLTPSLKSTLRTFAVLLWPPTRPCAAPLRSTPPSLMADPCRPLPQLKSTLSPLRTFAALLWPRAMRPCAAPLRSTPPSLMADPCRPPCSLPPAVDGTGAGGTRQANKKLGSKRSLDREETKEDDDGMDEGASDLEEDDEESLLLRIGGAGKAKQKKKGISFLLRRWSSRVDKFLWTLSPPRTSVTSPPPLSFVWPVCACVCVSCCVCAVLVWALASFLSLLLGFRLGTPPAYSPYSASVMGAARALKSVRSGSSTFGMRLVDFVRLGWYLNIDYALLRNKDVPLQGPGSSDDVKVSDINMWRKALANITAVGVHLATEDSDSTHKFAPDWEVVNEVYESAVVDLMESYSFSHVMTIDESCRRRAADQAHATGTISGFFLDPLIVAAANNRVQVLALPPSSLSSSSASSLPTPSGRDRDRRERDRRPAERRDDRRERDRRDSYGDRDRHPDRERRDFYGDRDRDHGRGRDRDNDTPGEDRNRSVVFDTNNLCADFNDGNCRNGNKCLKGHFCAKHAALDGSRGYSGHNSRTCNGIVDRGRVGNNNHGRRL
jgi:hypothetical protein